MGELDFSHVKTADPGDLVMFVDHSRGLPLGLGQHDVREVLARGHDADLLKVVVGHLDGYDFSLLSATENILKHYLMTKDDSHFPLDHTRSQNLSFFTYFN